MKEVLIQLEIVEHDYPEFKDQIDIVKNTEGEEAPRALTQIVEALGEKNPQMQRDLLDAKFFLDINVEQMLQILGVRNGESDPSTEV